MYRCYMLNFGYTLDEEFDTIEQCIEYGKSKGFEFSVLCGDDNEYIGSCTGVNLTWREYSYAA